MQQEESDYPSNLINTQTKSYNDPNNVVNLHTLLTSWGEVTRHLALQRGSLRLAPWRSSSVAKPPSMTAKPPHCLRKSSMKEADGTVPCPTMVKVSLGWRKVKGRYRDPYGRGLSVLRHGTILGSIAIRKKRQWRKVRERRDLWEWMWTLRFMNLYRVEKPPS